ncbi:MAG: divergent polysaccharide deacetylase family protein [Pseudomonadota bacterium]
MLPNALKESMAGAGVDDDDPATPEEDRVDAASHQGGDIGHDDVMPDSLSEPDETAVSSLADETALASEFPEDTDGNTKWDDDAVQASGDDIESAADKPAPDDPQPAKSKSAALPVAASILYMLGLGAYAGYLAYVVPPPAPEPPADISVTVAITGEVAVADPIVTPEPAPEPVIDPQIVLVEPDEPAPGVADPEPDPSTPPSPGLTPDNNPAADPVIVADGETPLVPVVDAVPQAVDRPDGTPPQEPQLSLQEASEFGPLPVIGSDGQRSARVYARQVVALDVPRIAIVMTDLGLDETRTQVAIERLPADISLAFHAYAPDLNDLIAAARNDGHESLLALPMEPTAYPIDDPGPNPLLVDVTPQDNRAALYRSLGSAEGYVGVTNFMGTALLEDQPALAPIMSEIADRGMIFIDNNTAINSVSETIAKRLPMPYGRSNRFIDALPTAADIDEQLQGLEAIARLNGVAIGFAQPFPITLQRLDEWLPLLRSRGIDLVPVSAVAKRPLGSDS